MSKMSGLHSEAVRLGVDVTADDAIERTLDAIEAEVAAIAAEAVAMTGRPLMDTRPGHNHPRVPYIYRRIDMVDDWQTIYIDPMYGLVQDAAQRLVETAYWTEGDTLDLDLQGETVDYIAQFESYEVLDECGYKSHLERFVEARKPFLIRSVPIAEISDDEERNGEYVGWALLVKVL